MVPLRIGGWAVRRWIRHPAAWVLALLLVAFPQALYRLSPLGVSGPNALPALELVYLAALLGSFGALVVLSLDQEFLELLPIGTRLLGEAAGTTMLLGITLTVTLLGLAWTSTPLPDAVPVLCVQAHLLLLVLILLRVPASTGARTLLAATLFWILPALVSRGPENTRFRTLLDPTHHLAPNSNFLPFLPIALALALIVAGCAWPGRSGPPAATAPISPTPPQ